MHTGRAITCGLVSTAVLTLGVAGCSAGPDYAPPKPNVPASWSALADDGRAMDAATRPSVAGAEASLAEWWKSFVDAELNALVERAVRADPELRLARARVCEARAARHVVAGDRLPTDSAFGAAAAESEREVATSLVSLYKALGGGWEVERLSGGKVAAGAAEPVCSADCDDRPARGTR